MSENLGQATQPGDYSMNSKPVKRRSFGRIIGIIIGAIVVVAIALTFFVDSATKAPVAASNSFLNAVQIGDASAAYSLFSSEAKAAVPSDQFNAVVNQVGPILSAQEKMTSKKVNAQTGSASTAEVVYEIPGTDGKTYSFTVSLTKEGETWKVLNFVSKAT